MTYCFSKKHGKKYHMFFMVEKAKQKVLLENCKCFLRKKKYSSAKSLFLLGRMGAGCGPDLISVNFDNIVYQW